MKLIKKMHFWGVLFTVLLGTIFHFSWEWSDRSVWTVVFSAINESTWEHLKLLFFPFLFFSIVEYFIYGKEFDSFYIIKLYAVLVGMSIIVVAFYTYTGVLGKNYLFMDIGLFILAVILAYYESYQYLVQNKGFFKGVSNGMAFLLLMGIVLAFAIFSFWPPEIGLFQSPV